MSRPSAASGPVDPPAPLVAHGALRRRLADALASGRLPASLLLHGPPGVGKQRLALWLGALLLCDVGGDAPCGECGQCRLSLRWRHPDLHWYFPRPRLKDGDAGVEEVLADLGEACEARLAAGGVYPPAEPTAGLFVATVRALVRTASLSPALARRRAFVVADAERMVPQEGADAAANAFLKLLEEPPPGACLILTSSEPTALLPTIRSRVVAVRVAPPTEAEWGEVLGQAAVAAALEQAGTSVSRARGSTERSLGLLLSSAAEAGGRAETAARALYEAATAVGGAAAEAALWRAAFLQGAAGARGTFAAVLDQLQEQLREDCRRALQRGDGEHADWCARACAIVEAGKARTAGNANPSLLAARLLRELRQDRPVVAS